MPQEVSLLIRAEAELRRAAVALADVTQRRGAWAEAGTVSLTGPSLATSSSPGGSSRFPPGPRHWDGKTNLLSCTFPGEYDEGRPKPPLGAVPSAAKEPTREENIPPPHPRPLHNTRSNPQIKSAHVVVIRYTGLPVN